MNIQKVDDPYPQHQALASQSYGGGGGGGGMIMHVPDVGAPRSNPLAMIWRRKGLLAAVVLVCLVGALAKYMFSTQVFRSEARLFVQTAGGSRSAGDGGVTAGATAHSSLATQCELIKSVSILMEVASQPAVNESKTLRETSKRLATLRDNLSATVEKDAELIKVSFDSPYPNEAQQILKAVIDAYTGFHTKEKRAHLAELEEWKRRTQLNLEKKQKELLDFKKANGALAFTGEKGNITMQKLARLQDELTRVQIETVNLKSALDSAREKVAKPSELRNFVEYIRSTGGWAGPDGNEQALRTQLTAMEAQAEELKRRYMLDHPSVRAAEATVASLRARIGETDRQLVETYLLSMEQKVTASKNQEAKLQGEFDVANRAAMALNEKAAEYDLIETDVKRLAAAVESADQKLIALQASANVGGPTIRVFDEPSPPGAPVKPQRNLMLFQGLIVGLILGCFAALVRDWTDQGLRSGDEITETLGIPLLGSVPHMPGPPNPLAQGRKVDLEPASDVAETYRTIRTAVFFGTPDRESRTILVTSPAPGDGKSTFASNLAIAMAQTGKRVLLVDCDFRRPVQHRIFECRPGVGLSTVLAGHESLEKAIQATGVGGLDILPAGPVPSNPSEILNSQSFNEVLEELSVRYEHVVVDSPPVMAVADSRILAAMCSVTILVLKAETTTRKAALHTRRALQSVGAAILGVVVNDVPRARDRYGDYGGYSGYRAKYNGSQGHGHGPEHGNGTTGGGGTKTTAMVPARSFLDLRRK